MSDVTKGRATKNSRSRINQPPVLLHLCKNGSMGAVHLISLLFLLAFVIGNQLTRTPKLSCNKY
jgi:hypothetical protein